MIAISDLGVDILGYAVIGGTIVAIVVKAISERWPR